MPKDTSFNVSLDLVVEPVGERSKVTATLDITDDGQPFANNTMVWHDMTEEGVDYVTHLFERVTGGQLPLNLPATSYARVLQIERRSIEALAKLNDFGEEADGKTRAEKAQMGKAMVAALGVTGKGKGRKLGHNK